jgi:hypothetical protein
MTDQLLLMIIYLILYIKVYLNLSTSIPKFGLFFFKDYTTYYIPFK